MTNDEAKDSIKKFFIELINLKSRSADRDNTVLLALKYDNFDDFVVNNSHMFIVHFSTFERFLKAVLRNFYIQQTSCINHNSETEHFLTAVDLFYDIANENYIEFEELVKKNWPDSYKYLKELFSKNLF